MPEHRLENRSRSGQSRWTDVLSVFIVLSLIALLLTPAIIDRQVQSRHDEIDHAGDPARTLVTEIQYLLARQTSTLRGYFITRNEAFLRQFQELKGRELTAYAELAPLAERLGSEVLTAFVELRTLSGHWHDRLDNEEIISSVPVDPAIVTQIPFEQTLYLDALASAARLDDVIAHRTSLRRQEIRSAERRGLVVSGILAFLALAASIAVAYLSHRVRMLASEAESRRLIAETALEKKERAVLARTRLLRGVTHDVKNPLGAADAYADLLELGLKGPLAPSQREFIGKIRHSLHVALDIIGDLLDLATAETGELQLETAPTAIDRVVSDVVEEYRGIVLRAGHTITLRPSPDLPVIVSEPNRLRQILSNLVSNAVKYTPPPGRIEAGIEYADHGISTRQGAWVLVSIDDSGPGVPTQFRETIFDEFSRFNLEAADGHGLGLAISRKLARLLGGDITIAESPLGGARFTLWLPVDSALAAGSAAQVQAAPRIGQIAARQDGGEPPSVQSSLSQ